MIRAIITHTFAIFIGAGIFASSVMGAALPAMNWAGHVYVAFAWPHMIRCAPVESGCDPMPPAWLGVYLFDVEGE